MNFLETLSHLMFAAGMAVVFAITGIAAMAAGALMFLLATGALS